MASDPLLEALKIDQERKRQRALADQSAQAGLDRYVGEPLRQLFSPTDAEKQLDVLKGQATRLAAERDLPTGALLPASATAPLEKTIQNERAANPLYSGMPVPPRDVLANAKIGPTSVPDSPSTFMRAPWITGESAAPAKPANYVEVDRGPVTPVGSFMTDEPGSGWNQAAADKPTPVMRYKTASGEWKDYTPGANISDMAGQPAAGQTESGTGPIGDRHSWKRLAEPGFTPSAPLSSLPNWHPAVQEDLALREAMAQREANIARAKALAKNPFAEEAAKAETWRAQKDYENNQIIGRGGIAAAQTNERKTYDSSERLIIGEYKDALRSAKNAFIGNDAGYQDAAQRFLVKARNQLATLQTQTFGQYSPDEQRRHMNELASAAIEARAQ